MLEKLRINRKRALLSQFQIAAMLGISQSYYSGVERGDIPLQPELKRKIAKILKVSEKKLAE